MQFRAAEARQHDTDLALLTHDGRVSHAGQIQGRVWRKGQLQDGFDPTAVADYLKCEDALVWLDLYEPDHAQQRVLAEQLGLSPWAVEDAVAPAERVKATLYATHTFITVYAVDCAQSIEPDHDIPSRTALTKHRISAFVLPRVLVTVRLAPAFDIEPVLRRWGQEYGVGALVHGLLDVVVDSHFDAVQVLDDGIESLEDVLFDPPGKAPILPRRTYQIRKDLVALRRVVLPMREVVNAIQHHRIEVHHAPQLDPLYVDLYDHVLRVSEWTDSLRDMISSVFETNLSLQDARLNTVMKKLTGWAAIIAVPTAITGFYGQNVSFPGYGTFLGFVLSSAVIAVISITLYVAFKRRDWL